MVEDDFFPAFEGRVRVSLVAGNAVANGVMPAKNHQGLLGAEQMATSGGLCRFRR